MCLCVGIVLYTVYTLENVKHLRAKAHLSWLFLLLFLLQVSGSMMDMNVLMACQLLLEQVFNDGNSPLLQQLYQHLLFDFRIWTKSHFAVCLGKALLSSALANHLKCCRDVSMYVG